MLEVIKKNPHIVFMLVVGTLVGCATTPEPVEEDTEAFALKVIADKVGVAADAQRDYAALVDEDRAVMIQKQAALDADLIDVDYIGKPQELLQTLAHRYGYKYVESGKRVDLRTVNIRVRRASPVEVMKNVGYQIDSMADVVLEKSAKVLRLNYKPIVNSKG